jgi:hypothetical protein
MATKEAETQSTDLTTIPQQGKDLIHTLDIRFADPSEIQWDIAQRLANATTPEELSGEGGPEGLRNHFGKPFFVRRVRFLPGRFEQGPGFYALIDAVDKETGEALTFTSGAVNVLIFLARAEQMDWLDRPVIAKEAETPTADGYRPYRLAFS